jgi:hypothetical protein
MKFILNPEAMKQFEHLRTAFEKKRKVNLNKTPSPIGMPTLFGGTDVKKRRKQIAFLEKMYLLLKKFFYHEHELKTDLTNLKNKPAEPESISNLETRWKANLMASRILIAAGLHIQKQTGNSENSALFCIINKCLGITEDNYLDDEDKEICFQTASGFVNSENALSKINSELWTLSGQTFLQEEWMEFVTFINKQSAPQPLENNFPVTTLIQPVFESAFSHVGSTLGWVIAEAINNSSSIISPQLKLNSFVSSLALGITLGKAGPAALAILAPAITAKLISHFCETSLPYISGTTMRYAGKGTSWLIGLPFDIAYNLLYATGSAIASYMKDNPYPDLFLNGIRIADGVLVINNNPIQFKLLSNSRLSNIHDTRLEITEKGELVMEKKNLYIPNNPMSLVIQELKETFASKETVPEDSLNYSV